MAFPARLVFAVAALCLACGWTAAKGQELTEARSGALAARIERQGLSIDYMRGALSACVRGKEDFDVEVFETLNPAEVWALYRLCKGLHVDFRWLEAGYDQADFRFDCQRRTHYRIGPDFILIAAQALPIETRIDLSYFTFDDGEASLHRLTGGPWSALEGQTISQSVSLTNFAYEYSGESYAAGLDFSGVTFLGPVEIGTNQDASWFDSCPDVIPDGVLLYEARFRGPVVLNMSPYAAQLEIDDSHFHGTVEIRFAQEPTLHSDEEVPSPSEETGLYPASFMGLDVSGTRFEQNVFLNSGVKTCQESQDATPEPDDTLGGPGGPAGACEPEGVLTSLQIQAAEFGQDFEISRAFGFTNVRFSGVRVENRLALFNWDAAEICGADILSIDGAVRFANVSASILESCLEIFPDAPPRRSEGPYGDAVAEGTGFNNLSFEVWRNLLTNPSAPSFLAQSSFNHTTSPLLLAAGYFEANQLALKARDSMHEHARLRTRDAPATLGLRSVHNTLQYEPLWTGMPFLVVTLFGAILYGFGARSEPIGALSLPKRLWVSLDFTLPILQLDQRHEDLIPQEGWVRHLIYIQRLTGAVLALYFAAVLTVLGL